MARREEPGVKPVTVSDRKGGTVQMWQAVADVGEQHGKRQQSRKRFATKAEAIAWRSGITADRARGTHVAPAKLTMRQGVEQWLRGLRKEQTTIDAYTAALRPVVEVLGDKPVQRVTKADIEALVDALIEGTTPRGKWASTSINPMLSRLRRVFDDLMGQGIVARNPARLVSNVRRDDTPDRPPPEYETFTPEQVKQLMKSVAGTEDSVLAVFSLLGLRRAEIAGMRWSHLDIDGDVPLLTVTRTITVSSKGASDRARTKTKTSKREWPLPKVAVRILTDARTRARRDRLAAGSAWQGEADGHVYRQALGEPYHPRTVNARWNAALDSADLPHIRLHDGRHTAATLLHLDGAPAAVVAAWLGHSSPATTNRLYIHTQREALMRAASQFDAMFG